jgi:1,4-alpha-glucan branching enzyme
VPDFFIKNLKVTNTDKQLSMWDMWQELTTRRPYEKNIGYCESHDQALVGDKTIIFWLADKEMYDYMSVSSQSIEIDRAIALHKMIRFVTLTLAGEGYLNFIGNEFGHPEWIDFPREGNNWSFKYAHRKWSLCDAEGLKYKYLAAFDKAMLEFVKRRGVLDTWDVVNLWCDDKDKILAFRKAGLVFLFNFNSEISFESYELPVIDPVCYRAIFNSDEKTCGGYARISSDIIYNTDRLESKHGKLGIKVYSPCRTAIVFARI